MDESRSRPRIPLHFTTKKNSITKKNDNNYRKRQPNMNQLPSGKLSQKKQQQQQFVLNYLKKEKKNIYINIIDYYPPFSLFCFEVSVRITIAGDLSLTGHVTWILIYTHTHTRRNLFPTRQISITLTIIRNGIQVRAGTTAAAVPHRRRRRRRRRRRWRRFDDLIRFIFLFLMRLSRSTQLS